VWCTKNDLALVNGARQWRSCSTLRIRCTCRARRAPPSPVARAPDEVYRSHDELPEDTTQPLLSHCEWGHP
jgi:hypothetical protein